MLGRNESSLWRHFARTPATLEAIQGRPIYVASTRSAAALVRNPRRAAAFERRRLREGGLESQHGECGPILPIRRRDRGEFSSSTATSTMPALPKVDLREDLA